MVVLSYSKVLLLCSYHTYTYVRQLLYKCDYKYRDILDNRDNFVVNIEIWFRALSHSLRTIYENAVCSLS